MQVKIWGEASMSKQAERGVDRRNFLRSIGTGAAGAVTVATMGAAATPAAAKENDAEKKKARYKETDHVKAFYRTNRY
jgi:hypothetical protein